MRRTKRRWLWLSPLLLLALQGSSACRWIAGYDEAQRDAGQPDIAREDIGQQDLPQADLPQADLPQADLPQADLPQADLLPPDILLLDLGCPRVSETHTQTLVQKVDVLFVIDTGGSMTDELPRIIQSAGAFANEAKKYTLNAQLGVIAVDAVTFAGKPMPLGALLGTPPVIPASDPQLETLLKQRIQTSSSGIERGLDAVHAALTPPLSLGSNAGFKRPNASLEVLAFTDEPDGSSVTPDQLLTTLRGLVNPPQGTHVRVHALVSLGSCGGQLSTEWQKLVQRTGGTLGDLCAPSYDSVTIEAAKRIFGLRDQFYLGQMPSDALQLTVDVDSTPSTNWSYDKLSNSVTFATPPGDSSKIDIGYPVCP